MSVRCPRPSRSPTVPLRRGRWPGSSGCWSAPPGTSKGHAALRGGRRRRAGPRPAAYDRAGRGGARRLLRGRGRGAGAGRGHRRDPGRARAAVLAAGEPAAHPPGAGLPHDRATPCAAWAYGPSRRTSTTAGASTPALARGASAGRTSSTPGSGSADSYDPGDGAGGLPGGGRAHRRGRQLRGAAGARVRGRARRGRLLLLAVQAARPGGRRRRRGHGGTGRRGCARTTTRAAARSRAHQALDALRALTHVPVMWAVQSRVAAEVAGRLTAGEVPGVAEAALANAQDRCVLVRLDRPLARELPAAAARHGAAPYPVGANSRYEIAPLFYRLSGSALADAPRARRLGGTDQPDAGRCGPRAGHPPAGAGGPAARRPAADGKD